MSNEGYIKLIGRSKEMIIRGGENVAPKEIEELLHQHPSVYEAFVSFYTLCTEILTCFQGLRCA